MTKNFLVSSAAAAVGVLTWACTMPVTAETVAAFYKGKTIVINMGFPGGGFFASAKLVGKHIQNHIPGNPKVVFKPRPGRVGTKVLDFLEQFAPKDGRYLAMPGSLGPWMPLQTRIPIKYDPRKMSYIGNVNSAGDTYLLVRADAGIRTLADLRSKRLRVGNARGAYKNFVAALNNILGTRITYVGNYPAHRDAFAAMLRGDTQGVAGAGVTDGAEHRRYFPDLLQDGTVIPILRYTNSAKNAAYPNIILAGKYGSTAIQKQALEIVFASQVLDRPLMGPSGMPPDRLAALQQAFVNTMRDPALIAEAKAKKLGIENPMSGPDMKAYVTKIFALPKAAKAVAQKALADVSFLERVRYTTFKAELAKVKRKYRSFHAVLTFKGQKGKPVVVQMDARTTKVTVFDRPIKIPPFKARSLASGLTCEVSWTGPGTTASVLVCGK